MDPLDQIWGVSVVSLFPVELQRPEPETGEEITADISLNKVLEFGCFLPLLCRSELFFLPCQRGADGGRDQPDVGERVGGRRGCP